MTGELLASAAQGHIAEGVVEPEAVEAMQDGVGVFGLHEQVVLVAQRGSRCCRGGCGGRILDLEGEVHGGGQGQPGVDSSPFSHVSLKTRRAWEREAGSMQNSRSSKRHEHTTRVALTARKHVS